MCSERQSGLDQHASIECYLDKYHFQGFSAYYSLFLQL